MSLGWGGGMAGERVERALTREDERNAAIAWLKRQKPKPVDRRRLKVNYWAVGGPLLAIALSALFWYWAIAMGIRHWKAPVRAPQERVIH